jgi:hypothetical protein
MISFFKKILSILSDAIIGIEDFMREGIKCVGQGFAEWSRKTQNPIHQLAIFALNLTFLAISLVVGLTILIAIAVLPVLLIVEFIKWLNGN